MRKIISLLLAVIIVVSVFTAIPFSVSAAEKDSVEVGALGGTTGECTWTLDNDGVLTISGNGKMGDYSYNNKNGYLVATAPWGEDIESVVIENGVTNIGDYAFFYCDYLISVTIPESVTSIGDYAFESCESLTSVTIPDSVTSIGVGAFSECENLKSVTIGNSVTSIRDFAFYDCTSLTSITIPDSVTSIGQIPFYGTKWYNNQPDGLIYAGKVAYHYKGTMPANASIAIKDGTKGIADFAFIQCKRLGSITIPDSVTSIGCNAFESCESLTSVTIPDSVTSIGDYAFFDCTSLTSITIPDSVKSIGCNAFGYNHGVNGWEKVDGFTIYGCEGSEVERYADKNGFTFIEISSEAQSIIGDLNGDNSIDVLDATVIQKYTVGKVELTDEQQELADVNNDNTVDILDATDIQKYAVDKITEFKKK